jgi:hypothetical protein
VDKACVRLEPHPSHFWNEAGWKPRHLGDKQFRCPGVEDPALAQLSEEQLHMAARELARRQDAARRLQAQEAARHRELRRAELALQYQAAIEETLTVNGVRPPPGPGAGQHEQWAPVLPALLSEFSDLMWDYREAKEEI